MMVLGMLSGCGNSQAEQSIPTDITSNQIQEPEEEPEDKLEFDTTFESIRVVVDGIVHNFDVEVADDVWYISAEDAQNAFGSSFKDEYVSLDAYAQTEDIHYTQDKVLNAAYFSTWEPYTQKANLSGFESYVEELNLPLDKLDQETVTGADMAELLDCFVAHEAPEQLDAWKEISVKLRASNDPLCRSDALAALFLASWKIGGIYMEYEKESSMQMREAAFDKCDDNRNWELFNGVPIPSEFDVGYGAFDHYGWGACIFNLGTVSPVDGSYPFSYNGTSFRHEEDATYLEAVTAIARVFSEKDAKKASVDDPAVTALSMIFTEELLAKATAPATVTAQNHPQWTGFVLGGEIAFNLNEVSDNVAICANWGFNSVRLNLDYGLIFNRDVTEVDLMMLNVLDQIIAQAVKYNIHLNICMIRLPGRWKATSGEFEDIGEFDLFLNEEKQEQAKRLFKVWAQRYKGISNDYLSFTPVWEPLNHNLSTGESVEPYTYADYAASLSEFIDAFHSIDPERLIIVEPTNLNDIVSISQDTKPVYQAMADKENIIFSYNFCDMPFVYSCMTTESGRNVDDENRSYYLAEYPTYYYDLDNHIVDPETESLRSIMPEGNFDGSGSLQIDGCLPAGTTVELYLRQTYGGQLQFIADGEVIYTEDLGHHVYNTGEALSRYINYAVSDKKISVTLTEDVESLEIATPGGALNWTAIDYWLPDEYAQERWYYATPYDVFQGLEDQAGIVLKKEARVMIWPYDLRDKEHKENRLTIHDDLTYTTPTVHDSSSEETIMNIVQTINDTQPGSIVRYECALFNGGVWSAMMDYYEDMFIALNEYEVGWWSNDWGIMTNDMSANIAGIQQIEYEPYTYFGLELLKLMQQYQNSERPQS
jgi:hypothetical protein